MAEMSINELRRHQLLATGLLILAIPLWSVASLVRLQQKWIAEHLIGMTITAYALLAIGVMWHLVVWIRALLDGYGATPGIRKKLTNTLIAFEACVLVISVWLFKGEPRLVPATLWAPDKHIGGALALITCVAAFPWAVYLLSEIAAGVRSSR